MPVSNRRTNALKHQHTHPATQTHPAVLKDAFSSAKGGHVNGVNVIGLSAQSSASPSNQPTSTSMSAKMASMTGGGNMSTSTAMPYPTGLLNQSSHFCLSIQSNGFKFSSLETPKSDLS